MAIDYIPLITGFVGAIVGAAASVLTILISSYFENKRHLNKLAYDAALEDHRTACDFAKNGGPRKIAPLTSYIHFHVKYMELVNANKLTESALKELKSERDSLWPELGGSK